MESLAQRLPHVTAGRLFSTLAILAGLAAIAFERGERPGYDGPDRISPISIALLMTAAAAIVLETSGRRWHRLVFGVAVLLPGAWSVLMGRNAIAPVMLVLFVAWIAYTRPRRDAIAGWAVTIGVLAVTIPFAPGMVLDWTGWIMGITFAAASGVILGTQRQLLADLRAAQAQLARQSARQERQRIARDLHDVIAHTMSITLLQVSGARHILQRDPERAAHALDEATALGRQSLTDIRRIVGILAEDGDEGLRSAPPGLPEIAALVSGFADAGLAVRLKTQGDAAHMPEVIGRELYRIVQESLNNVVRHATGATAIVQLDIGPTAVRLTIEDDGPRPGTISPTAMSHPGRGLVGLRERVETLGGRVTMGRYGAGWRVACEIPLATTAATMEDER